MGNVYPVTDENREELNALLDKGSVDDLKENTIIVINTRLVESLFQISLDIGKEAVLEWYNGSTQECTVQVVGVKEHGDEGRNLEDGVYIPEKGWMKCGPE
ncbi:hypothetical protein LC724_31150 [Blautia sp. RD014234]|nr:hypothetical protein [Blautia parvula]